MVAFNIRIEGKRAMFARPEFRHDLVSYDLLTPHAARGILDSIYWRPGMTWVIETIRILSPIIHEKSVVDGRRMAGLCDVAYDVRARFDLHSDANEGTSGRHAAMFRRAATIGQDIHLGRLDYGGRCSLVDEANACDTDGATVVDHGWLLHSIAFHRDRRPRFFRARSVGGLVDVPEDDSALVYG